MLKIIDHWIENRLRNYLAKQQDKMVRKAVDSFIQKNHPDTATLNFLKANIENAIKRNNLTADRNILKERVKRAKYTFWISALSSAFIVGILGFFSSGTLLPIILPLLTAVIAWGITLATIPLAYNQSIKSAIDIEIFDFEKNLAVLTEKSAGTSFTQDKIMSITAMLSNLHTKVDENSKKVAAISPNQSGLNAEKLAREISGATASSPSDHATENIPFGGELMLFTQQAARKEQVEKQNDACIPDTVPPSAFP